MSQQDNLSNMPPFHLTVEFDTLKLLFFCYDFYHDHPNRYEQFQRAHLSLADQEKFMWDLFSEAQRDKQLDRFFATMSRLKPTPHKLPVLAESRSLLPSPIVLSEEAKQRIGEWRKLWEYFTILEIEISIFWGVIQYWNKNNCEKEIDNQISLRWLKCEGVISDINNFAVGIQYVKHQYLNYEKDMKIPPWLRERQLEYEKLIEMVTEYDRKMRKIKKATLCSYTHSVYKHFNHVLQHIELAVTKDLLNYISLP